MNTNEPPDDEPEELIDKDDFLRKMREDPEFAAGMKEILEFTLTLPATPENAELQKLARQALKCHDSFDVMGVIGQKMEANMRRIKELVEDDDGGADGMLELREMVDSVTDDALDLPEPHRTNLIVKLTALKARWLNH